MSFDSAAKDTPGKGKNSVKPNSKTGTPITIKFRNPIIAYSENTPITDDKQAKGLDINSFGSSPTVRDRHSKNIEKLKSQNVPGHLMKKCHTTPNTPTNNPSPAYKEKQKVSKKYASSLPPPVSNGENSPLEVYTKEPELLLLQSPTQPNQQYKRLKTKENTDLLHSPKIQPNNSSNTKPNDRRFSVGIFADNQLPLSAVYEHNMIGSELGNEFSTLNEFLNLLDPDQQQLDVYNSISVPGTSKNNPHQFNPMSPNTGWLNGNSNAPSQNINYLKGVKSPQSFKELPNILETRSVVVNDNNYERIEPFPEQQSSAERDYQSQSSQKPKFERNNFNKNYTKHNFPTLKNHQPTAANQSSIYSGTSKVVTKPQNRFIKRASYTVSAKENFFLTAAAPSAVLHAKERLTEVIKAKLDAGLLKPYDYSKGYDRIHDFLTESSATMVNKQKIYKVLNDLRPLYVKITSKLKSVELVLVEESFEVMLLSLERVFSTIATPSCCWRRTGEIYRGNQEFATLAGCDIEDLRDGRLTIYELMDEESYCRYFELFGYSSLKSSQKAVLTHCNLKNRDVNCCFSFTIKRDEYNIPICIIGNFLPSE